MHPVGVGSEFGGYQLEALIGRGGMGVVYRARELALGRTVALKLVAPEAVDDRAAHERFVAEARVAASLEHPHVVPIYAAGDVDGIAYLVMRLIEGDDARTLVRREGALPPGRAATIAARAAEGLDAIHAAGLVHRDVKPANLLLGPGDHVYLTDFGLARAAISHSGATRTGRWAGTLNYAPPEQIRGGRIDTRADVYALGGVLHWLLTGGPPFRRETDEAVMWAHLNEPPPRPTETRPELPPAFDAVVARAMAKAPEDRFPTAGELGAMALRAADGDTITAAVPVRRPARARRLRPAVAVAAGLGLTSAVVVTVLATGGGDPAPVRHAAAHPPATLAVRGVGLRPNDLALVGRELWVTSAHQRYIVRVDAQTGRKLAAVPGVGIGVRAIAARGRMVWVTNSRRREILGIDARTRRLVRELHTAGAPVQLAVGDSGLWAVERAGTAGGADTLLHYDTGGHRLQPFRIPQGLNAIALGAGALWMAERNDRWILRLAPRSGATRSWAELEQPATALAFGGGKLWASIATEGAVARVDPHGRAPYESRAAQEPKQLAFAGGRVFVASFIDHVLVKLDPVTLKPDGRPIPVGPNPDAVTADARHVWVTSLADGSVTRVDVG